MDEKIDDIKDTNGTLMSRDGLSAKCPICGVWSNLWPDYQASEGTALIHRLSFCDHPAVGHLEIRETLGRKEEGNDG